MTFDPHDHPHDHPAERQLPSLEPEAVARPEHGRQHASVWLSGVRTGYDGQVALDGVDLAVEPGTLLAVVGPNGAGKSTLLKLMAGLLPVWEGDIRILGDAPGRNARRIAYVPQAELVDWAFPVTVADVVMMGRYPGLGPWRRRARGPGVRGTPGRRWPAGLRGSPGSGRKPRQCPKACGDAPAPGRRQRPQ